MSHILNRIHAYNLYIYIYNHIFLVCFLAGPYIFIFVFPKGGVPTPQQTLLLRWPILFSKALKVGNQDFGPVWVSTAMKASLEKVADGKLPQTVPQKMEEVFWLTACICFFLEIWYIMISWLQKFKPFESGLHHLHPIFLEIFYLLLWWLVTSTHERICRVSFASQIGACSKSEIRKLTGVCDL